METIKPKTNIPILGTLRYVNYQKSKTEGWKDQVCLVGTWDDHGEGRIYGPLFLKDELEKIGAITKPVGGNGSRLKDKFGNPAYKVVGSPRVLLLKSETEEGVRWQVNLGDSAGADHQPEERATSHEPHDDAPPQSSNSKQWAQMRDTWVKCAKLARNAHNKAELECDDDRIAQTATSFFIEANRKNLS